METRRYRPSTIDRELDYSLPVVFHSFSFVVTRIVDCSSLLEAGDNFCADELRSFFFFKLFFKQGEKLDFSGKKKYRAEDWPTSRVILCDLVRDY